MTKLQIMALEHVDQLIIHAHNEALEITDLKEVELMQGEEIGYIASRGHQLAKDLHHIQMWIRTIKADPQK